ncbi:MAG: hypothetical protein KKC99_03720, partial [Proteobacteria bacterium]|nr:hypothetical protein [Pseudomonadota bacterium]
MAILAGVLITVAFAALGFFIALKLAPERKENKEKFLMTALLCVALAVVISGLVRKPVMKLLREGNPAGSIQSALDRNELFALLREASPQAAKEFRASTEAMGAKSEADGLRLRLTDWDVSVILWEKLVPAGVGIAPDEAALLFAKGLAERLRELNLEDPILALALLSPRSFPDGDPSVLALTGTLGQGVHAVVLGAFKNPVPLNDPDESRQLFDSAMADYVRQLTETHDNAPDLDRQLAVLEDPAALRQADDGTLPLLVADLLEYLLSRPAEEQPVLVK